jgi:hypothetical protein
MAMRTSGGSSGGETSMVNDAGDGEPSGLGVGAGVGLGLGVGSGVGVGPAPELHPASSRTAPRVSGSARIGVFLDDHGTPMN